ncbi:MAG: hypothetical protein AB1630_10270 [bacterium]
MQVNFGILRLTACLQFAPLTQNAFGTSQTRRTLGKMARKEKVNMNEMV